MLKTIRNALVALFMFAPAAAFAADLPAAVEAGPVSVPSFSWTGAYVGVFAAYHDGKVNERGCTGLCRDGVKIKDPYLGVQAGYDHQFDNNVVLGALSS